MKLFVWKYGDTLQLSRPVRPSQLVQIEFDPDSTCRQCGEAVLSISAAETHICPWCASGTNRPKMLRYQELDIIRSMQEQSDSNQRSSGTGRKSLVRNGVTERDLRDYLTAHNYSGRSARILKLDLKAIERPGWVQVFEFHVQVKRVDGDWEELRGLCRTDERNQVFEVTYFDTTSRDGVLQSATDGLITGRRTDRHWIYWPLMAIFVLMLLLAIISAAVSFVEESGISS